MDTPYTTSAYHQALQQNTTTFWASVTCMYMWSDWCQCYQTITLLELLLIWLSYVNTTCWLLRLHYICTLHQFTLHFAT